MKAQCGQGYDPRLEAAIAYLEEFFKWRVYHGVGNKRQGIEREKLRGLAQGCPFGLQVGFEIRHPFIQFLFVLRGREAAHWRSPAWCPVRPSTLSLRGSFNASHVAGSNWSPQSPPGLASTLSPVILMSPPISPLHETSGISEDRYMFNMPPFTLPPFSHILKILHRHHL